MDNGKKELHNTNGVQENVSGTSGISIESTIEKDILKPDPRLRNTVEAGETAPIKKKK